MAGRNYYSDQFISEAIQRLRKGHASFRATARRLGISERTLRRWYVETEHGATSRHALRHRSKYSQTFILEALEWIHAGVMSIRATAKLLGIPESTLRRWCKRFPDNDSQSNRKADS